MMFLHKSSAQLHIPELRTTLAVKNDIVLPKSMERTCINEENEEERGAAAFGRHHFFIGHLNH